MTARIASLWRHPIKALGREPIDHVTLAPGRTLPGDRLWAVAHDASDAQDGAWDRCGQFLRAAASPALMAIEARTEGDVIHLTHPDRPPLAVNPDTDGAALVDWVQPLVAEGRPAAARVVRAAPDRGMTDTPEPTITLGNLKSHAIVAARLGRDLSIHRWRCNIWVEGLAPWEEFDLVGRRLRLGAALVEVTERVGRCRATEANPDTGRRDADTLGVLDAFGHQDFTVAVTVVEGGRVAPGDALVPA